jgi:outer membrane protein OmpA-like peptidoglycan-associated protein
VVGHTCAIGGPEINRRTGLWRAQAARNLLVRKGLDPTRIRVGSAGADQPAAANDSARGRAQNRRVTLLCQPEAGGQP